MTTDKYLDNMNVFLSLASGLIGSVVGAVATWLVSRNSIKSTFAKSIELDKKKRQQNERQNIKLAQLSILAESEENLESLNIWNQYRRKFRFNTHSWNAHKSSIQSFKPKVQKKLIQVYSKMSRFNTLIDYDLRTPHGLGSKDAEIERQAEDVREALEKLLKEIK